jgi:hypothetical protein
MSDECPQHSGFDVVDCPKCPISTLLPGVIYLMCVHGAYIVGSYAKFLAGEDVPEPQDYDLLVPLEKWQGISLLIPSTAKLNKFGGWRFICKNGKEVDVWPDTLENYLTKCKSKHGGTVLAVDFINNRVFSMHPLTKEE